MTSTTEAMIATRMRNQLYPSEGISSPRERARDGGSRAGSLQRRFDVATGARPPANSGRSGADPGGAASEWSSPLRSREPGTHTARG